MQVLLIWPDLHIDHTAMCRPGTTCSGGDAAGQVWRHPDHHHCAHGHHVRAQAIMIPAAAYIDVMSDLRLLCDAVSQSVLPCRDM